MKSKMKKKDGGEIGIPCVADRGGLMVNFQTHAFVLQVETELVWIIGVVRKYIHNWEHCTVYNLCLIEIIEPNWFVRTIEIQYHQMQI